MYKYAFDNDFIMLPSTTGTIYNFVLSPKL